jgi:hypothetical protein
MIACEVRSPENTGAPLPLSGDPLPPLDAPRLRDATVEAREQPTSRTWILAAGSSEAARKLPTR